MRSFLQVKSGVNKGICDTLRDQPDRFLAYNNGLAATADEIEVGTFAGETVIHRVRGLQVVNGGQTLASIHRARKVDKLDIGRVSVAMKLTRVEPAKLTEFVPLIAKYANTQNVIQVADLSANSEFHIAMEIAGGAESWCPGEVDEVGATNGSARKLLRPQPWPGSDRPRRNAAISNASAQRASGSAKPILRSTSCPGG